MSNASGAVSVNPAIQVGRSFPLPFCAAGGVRIRLGRDGFWSLVVERRGATEDVAGRWLMLDKAQVAAEAWLRDHAS